MWALKVGKRPQQSIKQQSIKRRYTEGKKWMANFRNRHEGVQ